MRARLSAPWTLLLPLVVACAPEGPKDATDTDPGAPDTGSSDDSGDTGTAGDSGAGDSGAGDSGAGDSGAGDSGAGDSGDSGAGDSGAGDSGDSGIASFKVRGTLTGFGSSAPAPTQPLELVLDDGTPLSLSANGAFSFPTSIADGASFEVRVRLQPSCPGQVCVVTGGTGTVNGQDVSVTVACHDPTLMLFTSNWRDTSVTTEKSIRIVDDLDALASNATATPRVVTGAATRLGQLIGNKTLAVDPVRGILYVASDDEVLAYDDPSSITGNAAPSRVIDLGLGRAESVVVDPARDRLYVIDGSGLYTFAHASTLSGAASAAAIVATLGDPYDLEVDPRTDRLWVSDEASDRVVVFDDASTITSSSTPDRDIRLLKSGVPDLARTSLTVDACTDRLYVGTRERRADGYRLHVVAGASTLDGDVDLTAGDDLARLDPGQVLALTLDPEGRLYFVQDSDTRLRRFDAPTTWSGNVSNGTNTLAADWTLLGMIANGYGVAFWPR